MVYSKTLLVILIFINMLSHYGANMVSIKIYNTINKNDIYINSPTFLQSILVWSISLLFLWGLIYSILALTKKKNRVIQILISLAAIDIILKLLKICIILLLQISTILALILLIPLLYWEFVIYIYVFANSFDIKYLKAGIFALIYIIMQYNIGGAVAYYITSGPQIGYN